MLVDVYGGPGVQRVSNAWGNLFHQYLVQHGYVVFVLDNRGSGFRGVRFESALYKPMGLIEVQDQVTGVEYLKSLPYVDPARIGVSGWSYGGYLALMCMMQAVQRSRKKQKRAILILSLRFHPILIGRKLVLIKTWLL